ncbi:NAC domain containing protein [Melia azedarach]|uniref:NAC domain containing protein n=1 Tax=Melia azedarach TaxID=155640 RepID=A0ACC1YZH6_MELAZ|nr:NAC domain containing protein [Melia azedarach]
MGEFVGFRFHPTEQEIISYFLEMKMRGLDFPVHTVAEVDICKFEPYDLPQRSPLPPDDQVWYFFNAPAYKSAGSKRTERTTGTGFWKLTGKDRPIRDKQGKEEIGFKRNLVFYSGRVRNGIKTNWVMHEYHSNNATSYQEYVLFRLKRKSGDRSDTCNVSNHHLASNPGNNVAAAPQENHALSEELEILLANTVLDPNSLPALLSRIQPEQETLDSNGFGNEHNLSSSHFHNTEQDNAFVDSLWAENLPPGGRRIHTLLNDFNPSKSLRKVYVGDSSDTDTEHVYSETLVLQSASLSDENTSLENYPLQPMEPAFYGTSSSDGELYKAEKGFFDEIVDSDMDMPEINCLELVVDEFPTETRACKSQHNIPKSHSFIEKKCAPQELHLQNKALCQAVSKVKAREAAMRADFPKTENSIVKFAKDQKMAQTSDAKASLTFRSNKGERSNRKGSFTFLETPALDHKKYPPSVYLSNLLISLILIIFFAREIMYLH